MNKGENNLLTPEEIRAMPKVELHTHLDCCLSFDVVSKLRTSITKNTFLLHLEQGLSPENVVSIVEESMSEAVKETGVEARLILCTLRHFTEEQSMTTAKPVEDFPSKKIPGTGTHRPIA